MNRVYSRRNKFIALLLTAAMALSCFAFMQAGTAKAASGKNPANSGTNIKNAVFYIAVDADNDGTVTGSADRVYYYTLNEIKAYGDQVSYHYGNHGEGETATVKGAELSNMLKDLKGISIDSRWKIQYAESDAFHATSTSSIDTVQGLTDKAGDGNASGAGIPAETIIGYQCKMTFDKPDANNVNDKTFNDFTTFVEPSLLRAYRQTNNANTSVLKNFMGVVISVDGDTLTGDSGYTERSFSDDDYGMKIASDKTVNAIPTGMRWAAAPRTELAYAKLSTKKQDSAFNGTSISVVGGADAADVNADFYWTETTYFKTNANGTEKNYLRSDLIDGASQAPEQPTASPNKYWGYNKPMYVRYNGQWLKDLVNVPAGQKAYVVKADGTLLDITSTLNNYFVAYSYQQSKRSTNIVDYNRKTVNYGHSVLVDTASAAVEASDGDSDYTVASGKTPNIIENAKAVIVTGTVAVPAARKAVKVKKKTAKIRWAKVAGAAGYQLQYGRNKSLTKARKTINVKNGATTSKTIKKLKKHKRYYVKVRAYKTVEGQTFYSSWSSVKTFKTKAK